MFGIVAASMSTADGAILAMGTVFSHNVMRQFEVFSPNFITNENLLNVARAATIPLTLASTLIAAYFRSGHPAGATGYLLIVAFDVVLATVVVPLFGCYYCKNPSPRAALLTILTGGATRVILEFSLPKDGYLLLPYKDDEFLDYGSAASANFPPFFDEPQETIWDPTAEKCSQRQFEDYTGVDSLAAFFVSFLVFVTVQTLEHCIGRPLFNLPGMVPYMKVLEGDDDVKDADPTGHTRKETNEGSNEEGSPEELSEASA